MSTVCQLYLVKHPRTVDKPAQVTNWCSQEAGFSFPQLEEAFLTLGRNQFTSYKNGTIGLVVWVLTMLMKLVVECLDALNCLKAYVLLVHPAND